MLVCEEGIMVKQKRPKYQKPAKELRRGRASDAQSLLGAPSRQEILADAARADLDSLKPHQRADIIQGSSLLILASVEHLPIADYWFKRERMPTCRRVLHTGENPPPKPVRLIDWRKRQLKLPLKRRGKMRK